MRPRVGGVVVAVLAIGAVLWAADAGAMPQVIPLIAYAAFASSGFGALVAGLAAAAASYAVTAYQGFAARDVPRGFAGEVAARGTTVRSSVESRKVVLGRTVIGGVLVYWCRSGTNREWLHLVVALSWKQITAIDSVYLNDVEITSAQLDGQGFVNAGPFLRNIDTARTHFGTVPATGPFTVTLPASPFAITGVTDGGQEGQPEAAFVDVSPAAPASRLQYSRSGLVFTFHPDVANAAVYIHYTERQSVPHVRLRRYLGSDSQTADAELIAESGGEWTSAHRGRGQPYVIVSLRPDVNLFPQGLPAIRALVRGAQVLDPRTNITAYSENIALLTRHYLAAPWGFASAASEIDTADAIASANICEELVQITPGGQQQPRYFGGGVVDTAKRPAENLRDILSGMAGTATYVGGRWRVLAGAYRAPALTLDEDDLRGRIVDNPVPSRAQRFNAVRGTYLDPNKSWQPGDFPPVRNALYQNEDGQPLFRDIDLPFTYDAMAAQRLAKQHLERARQGIIVTAQWKYKALDLRVWSTVRLNIPTLGYADKDFIVTKWALTADGLGCETELQEEAAASYNWNFGQATVVDPAPDTNIPSIVPPMVGPLTVASGAGNALITGDGTQLVRLRVSWPAIGNEYVRNGGRVEIRYRRTDETEWADGGVVAGIETTAYVSGVSQRVFYLVQARAVSQLGQYGPWSDPVLHYCVAVNEGGPLAPNLLTDGAMQSPAFGSPLLPGFVTAIYTGAGTGAVNKLGPGSQVAGDPAGGVAMSTTGGVATIQSMLLQLLPRQRASSVTDGLHAVVPSRRYQLSAYAAASALACHVRMYINWYTSAGTFISQVRSPLGQGSVASADNRITGPSLTADWKRIWVFADAPANAGLAGIFFGKADDDPQLPPIAAGAAFAVTRALFGEATPLQAEPSPWVPGGVYRIDHAQLVSGAAQEFVTGAWAATTMNIPNGPQTIAQQLDITTIGRPVRIELSHAYTIDPDTWAPGLDFYLSVERVPVAGGTPVNISGFPRVAQALAGADELAGSASYSITDTPPPGAWRYTITYYLFSLKTGGNPTQNGWVFNLTRSALIIELRN